ncbi:hypothetical protein QUB60_14300 [Microcoleus sp. A2-C5]|uniref:hypothetical protein n=1 Tax=unclassified Microcoleus TaxID=2642155 RepID=UPI002FCF1684
MTLPQKGDFFPSQAMCIQVNQSLLSRRKKEEGRRKKEECLYSKLYCHLYLTFN